ncbi:hypothetical protein GCM10012289_44190 [Nonomuraea cavernae]|uniref:Uncharacterized protein n=1 Tax=Nonomuraea cavernae TaxID=2045107 RepID=A0A918DN88_9ACTN|nr:hypothetical protein GCM10012289_44190 [Nonomuraea cavernae]
MSSAAATVDLPAPGGPLITQTALMRSVCPLASTRRAPHGDEQGNPHCAGK